MSPSWLIIADDLTGAADCGIAFAKRGIDSVVAWEKHLEAGQARVLAVDAATRRLPAELAAKRQAAVLAAHYRPGLRLYKKIDSTIRGQPAAELAALLAFPAARSQGRSRLAVVTPAFPGTGRAVVEGRVLLGGKPLEQTPLWALDHTYASASLPEILASAGLRAEVLPLEVVGRGAEAVAAGLQNARQRGASAVVCDATTETHLASIAAASLPIADEVVWVGSAGLAAALASIDASPSATASREGPRLAAGTNTLIVVGSLAEASRRQAKTLVDAGLVHHVMISPDALFSGSGDSGWQQASGQLCAALAAGGDALLELAQVERPDLSRGAELAERLADFVEPAAGGFGALIATGGDTVYALLSKMGIHSIRLLDEVEPGVPLGVTVGARSIPVVTKAGAFGDAETLRHSLERLHSG